MANIPKQPFKAWVRVDGQGRDVSSSLILRLTKPKNGNWRQVQGYTCCDNQYTTTTSTSTTSTTSTTTTAPSDIRLKQSITLTGKKRGLLNEYSWEWNDKAKALGLDTYKTVGILAQEAMNVYPEAVLFDEQLGYLVVDYSKIPQ